MIRDVAAAGMNTRTGAAWVTPTHPVELIDLSTLSPSADPTLCMRYFDCNAPDMVGYSVATTGLAVVSIHSHRQGKDTAFYKGQGPQSIPTIVDLHASEPRGSSWQKSARSVGFTRQPGTFSA